MRIYSKTLLSWPTSIHVAQAARLYPGRWQNYYFYRVTLRDPNLVLHTYSPLELLQENSPFYCYDRYNRDTQLEKPDNELILTTLQSIAPTFTKKYIYIPKLLEKNDIIVVRSDINKGLPSIYLPSLFKTPGPVLA